MFNGDEFDAEAFGEDGFVFARIGVSGRLVVQCLGITRTIVLDYECFYLGFEVSILGELIILKNYREDIQ